MNKLDLTYLDKVIDKERITNAIRDIGSHQLKLTAVNTSQYSDIQKLCHKNSITRLREAGRELRVLLRRL